MTLSLVSTQAAKMPGGVLLGFEHSLHTGLRPLGELWAGSQQPHYKLSCTAELPAESFLRPVEPERERGASHTEVLCVPPNCNPEVKHWTDRWA
jgi:hypothetical protein